MAELADATDLGSVTERRAGSNPVIRTKIISRPFGRLMIFILFTGFETSSKGAERSDGGFGSNAPGAALRKR